MIIYTITLSFYFLSFSVINIYGGLLGKDEICKTPKNQKGQCILLGECPPLLNLLKKKPLPSDYETRLREANCGFQGIHPKVCCQFNVSGETQSTTPQPVVVPITQPPIPAPPLSKLLPNINECGYFMEDRVLLGDETQLDGYPWTVLLEYETPKNGNGFHCGGVLINKRYVLTAAHCIPGKGIEENWKLVGVRLGEYDRDSDKDCDSFSFAQFDCCCSDDVINADIEETMVHEQYDSTNKARYNDIALLRLAEKINYSDFVRPICLQPVESLTNGSLPGKSTTISGWGITELRSNSNKKQWGHMQIKNNAECETAYGKKGLQLRENHICAFVESGQKNSCSQDSGGALMSRNNEANGYLNYFAVGLMSLGHPICGLNEYPVIYTKVENYIPWIISKLKP